MPQRLGAQAELEVAVTKQAWGREAQLVQQRTADLAGSDDADMHHERLDGGAKGRGT